MLRAILIVLVFMLYSMMLIDSVESKVKEDITRNCLNLNSYLTLNEAEKLCKDMVDGWHSHAENPEWHQ